MNSRTQTLGSPALICFCPVIVVAFQLYDLDEDSKISADEILAVLQMMVGVNIPDDQVIDQSACPFLCLLDSLPVGFLSVCMYVCMFVCLLTDCVSVYLST